VLYEEDSIQSSTNPTSFKRRIFSAASCFFFPQGLARRGSGVEGSPVTSLVQMT
jgi:hypothetical protein